MTSWRLRIRWFSKAWKQLCKRSRLAAGHLERVWLCMKCKAVAKTCSCNEDRRDHPDRVDGSLRSLITTGNGHPTERNAQGKRLLDDDGLGSVCRCRPARSALQGLP